MERWHERWLVVFRDEMRPNICCRCRVLAPLGGQLALGALWRARGYVSLHSGSIVATIGSTETWGQARVGCCRENLL